MTDVGGPDRKGVLDKAIGEAAEAFGKEIAPLGPNAGALTRRIGDLLIRAMEPLVYGLEKGADWIEKAVSERLKNVPAEDIVAPNPRIAVPAMQALTYSVEDATIREMFANLLAADMNTKTKHVVHPAFVEMIKELASADAKVLVVVSQQSQVELYGQFRRPDRKTQVAGYSTTVAVSGLDEVAIRKALSNLKRLEIVEARLDRSPLIAHLEKCEEDLRKRLEPKVAELNALSEEEKKRMGIE